MYTFYFYYFAKEIFRLAERQVEIEEIPSSAYPTPALRPLNSRLNISKLEHLLGTTMPSWEESLNQCLKGEIRDLTKLCTFLQTTQLLRL